MVLVNGGFLHCSDIKNSCKFFSENNKEKMARTISKNQVSDPGPSWPSCFVTYYCILIYLNVKLMELFFL